MSATGCGYHSQSWHTVAPKNNKPHFVAYLEGILGNSPAVTADILKRSVSTLVVPYKALRRVLHTSSASEPKQPLSSEAEPCGQVPGALGVTECLPSCIYSEGHSIGSIALVWALHLSDQTLNPDSSPHKLYHLGPLTKFIWAPVLPSFVLCILG